jgi:protein-tyrosine kinase
MNCSVLLGGKDERRVRLPQEWGRMSKYFELMHEAGMRVNPTESAKVQPQAWTFDRKEKELAKCRELCVDEAAQAELLNLVQRVFQPGSDVSPRVVVFAGAGLGSGCGEICAHTAETLAAHKLGTVCLVDGNLRSPSLPDFFGVNNHYGLSDALREQGSIRGFSKQVGAENLWLLSSGSLAAESSSLLSGQGMKSRVAELRREFDYVLINVPALNTYADGIALGRLADGVVLIVEANCTRRESAGKVAESLRAAHITILGAILNKRTYPIPERLYRML